MTTGRQRLVIGLPVVLFIAVILAGLGFTMLRGPSGVRTSSLLNRPAPDFTIETFDRKPVDLASLKGTPVVINFWGSWCEPCKDEAPVLASAWQKYQAAGVQFVGIAVWDQPDAARAFAQHAGAAWINGLDNDGKIAIDYGVYGVPESFFVNREGILVERYVGPFLAEQGAARLDGYIERLLSR